MKIPFLLTFVFLWLHSGAFHWAPVLRHHHRSMQLLKPRWLAGHKMAHVPSCLYSCEYRSIHNKVTRTYSLDTDQCAEPTGPVARGVRRRGRLVEVLPRDAIIKEDGDQEPSDEDNGRADVIQTANEDEDELTGAGGAADENVVEENVPLSEPERFSRVFVATADIVDSELRDSAWDAHMQWIRRGCLDPDADFEVSWAMTGLDPACTEPRSQVLVLRANSSAPVAAALGVSSDLHRASEPLVSVGGVSEWAVFEASVDDELNVSMPVRAPHVFIGLFNTSCKDYDDSPLGEAHTPLNVVSNSNVALESGGRIGDSFVPELTPRAVAAEAARRAAESSLRRRLRLQREFHLAMSPHPPPPRADDGDSRDPYDLSSPLTEDADGDASPGGGYMEERASRAANDEAVGGFVSLFATLYSIRDEDRHKNIPTSRIGSDAAIGLSATMHAEARLPVGSFMVLNAASLVEARKYAGLDPLSGDMFAKVYLLNITLPCYPPNCCRLLLQPPRIFPANLQDTDGRHHLMGDTYYAQQELDAVRNLDLRYYQCRFAFFYVCMYPSVCVLSTDPFPGPGGPPAPAVPCQ